MDDLTAAERDELAELEAEARDAGAESAVEYLSVIAAMADETP